MKACVDLPALAFSDYRFVSGTSDAAPLIADTAALILDTDPSSRTNKLRDTTIDSATNGRIRI